MLPLKQSPRHNDFKTLLPPNFEYSYFDVVEVAPFHSSSQNFELVNATWLADASLLAYAPPAFAWGCLKAAGLQEGLTLNGTSTQGYVAVADDALIVTFRGSQLDNPLAFFIDGILIDADVVGVPWEGTGSIHKGFAQALEEIWEELLKFLNQHIAAPNGQARAIWFTGHSLGGALATLGAARYTIEKGACGLYTFGSPRVGDKTFASAFPVKTAFRIINNKDLVPRIPPRALGYKHVGDPIFIDQDGKLQQGSGIPGLPGDTLGPVLDLSRQLNAVDHAPIYYATYMWNDLARGTAAPMVQPEAAATAAAASSDMKEPNMFVHAPDPMISLWQSAVSTVIARRMDSQQPPPDHHPLVMATNAMVGRLSGVLKLKKPSSLHLNDLVEAVGSLKHEDLLASIRALANTGTVTKGLAAAPQAISRVPLHCAQVAFQIGLALVAGDTDRATALEKHFHFGTCDRSWLEVITEFVSSTLHRKVIPYRRWRDLSDFVLDGDGFLPSKATIAIVGDWGTGDELAQLVLDQVVSHRPDIFIHLGDIYYAGKPDETDRVKKMCDAKLPGKAKYTLAGNHDMYSGGQAYYDLLDHFGQPASFFCLRNTHWQLLAMDTGYNDAEVLRFLSFDKQATSLRQDNETDEAQWHLDKIENAGGRRTIVISHHQLFSATGVIGNQITNDNLYSQIGSVLDKIDLWMWGHEHSHLIFKPYQKLGAKILTRGRCIGASAIPVPANDPEENPYRRSPGANVPEFLDKKLGLDPTRTLFNQGYAILRLDGAHCKLEHYDHMKSEPFHTDDLNAPITI